MSVLIIAEAGVNHNGSLDMAKRLVDAASEAGADVVKFQTFVPELTVTKNTQQADYQVDNIGKESSQLDMLSNLTLSFKEHQDLASYCQEKKIGYLSTAFDLPSLDEVLKLGVNCLKIPSGEITHFQLLKAVAATGLPIILSTGMSTEEDIALALSTIHQYQPVIEKVTLLHCNTEYPTPMCDVNLNVLHSFSERFDVNIGYSDHTQGIEVPIAAVALGAQVIEKHFTISRDMEGPDHKASLEPQELTAMVSAIRNIEAALGSSVKQVTNSEAKNLHIARKYLVVCENIRAGDVLSSKNIMAKRIGQAGISPMQWPNIEGQTASRDRTKDDILTEDDWMPL
jgi:N,N'-diacetyllegionaminate synthase